MTLTPRRAAAGAYGRGLLEADVGPTPVPVGDLVPILRRHRWTVLSGAGMSTASGIPDYRGPDGTRRVQPMTIQEFRGSATARRRYWARSYVGWPRFAAAGPNAAHRAVTALQRSGRIGPVITQNVDGLHQAAGTTEVHELHGSLAEVVCEACDARIARSELDLRLRADNPGFAPTDTGALRPDGDVELAERDVDRFVAPRCHRCDSDRVRPAVVFFGDSVDPELVQRCYRLVDGAEALLVLGSSLMVMSGLRFVRRAAQQGTPVVILTRGATRGDAVATVRCHTALERALPLLALLS